jgi:hypothetical protein
VVLTFLSRYPKFANLYRDHGTGLGGAPAFDAVDEAG